MHGPFGVEITGVDVNRITEAELEQARVAQREQGVVFFRHQQLSCEQHIAFAERWGNIVVNRFFETVPGYPQIAQVRKEPTHKTAVGLDWHTDHSYDQAPAMGSILNAREIPEKGGGTEFASMYLAYDALSDGLKQTLEGLTALHSSRQQFGQAGRETRDLSEDRFKNAEMAIQDSVHPVVITHPESGKKALYVNPDFTVKFTGWSLEESTPLLECLFQHASSPQFVIRFGWKEGDIAFWDNRATWHRALNDYPNGRRLMHRITLEGCELNP